MGGGCYSCTAWLFVFLNFIFLIFGVAGIAGSIYMLVDPTFTFQLTQNPGDATISLIILLVASIILFLAGVIGIWATLAERRWGVVMCFCLLLIIVVAEIATGVWGYIHRNDLETQIRINVQETVKRDYRSNNDIKALFDTFQEKLECCGADKPNDWMNTGEINLGISNPTSTYSIPESCCRKGISDERCRLATQNLKIGSPIDSDTIYDKGCFTLIVECLYEHMNIIVAVGGAVLIVELLGLILALCIAFSMNRTNRYKA
ncbi:CD151 antigen [Aethina tumida]|uniref:CD151 antigen n=1 Tax=Aethina tumida TaxID=116153 RepID=UPI002148D6D5|nr:CD151 antigen [Aethina tumida]